MGNNSSSDYDFNQRRSLSDPVPYSEIQRVNTVIRQFEYNRDPRNLSTMSLGCDFNDTTRYSAQSGNFRTY